MSVLELSPIHILCKNHLSSSSLYFINYFYLLMADFIVWLDVLDDTGWLRSYGHLISYSDVNFLNNQVQRNCFLLLRR